MNKLELIQKVKDQIGMTEHEAADVVQIFFNSLSEAFGSGERVEIRGLCSFYIKDYQPYTGRNPKTGEKVTVDGKKLPFFKVGKELKDRVNNKE